MALFSSIRFSLRILRKHAKLSCIAVFPWQLEWLLHPSDSALSTRC